MKTTFLSLEVDLRLKIAVEEILGPDETLSGFMEQSLRLNLERRQGQRDFLARGLEAREEARRSGEYCPASEVLDELDTMLNAAEFKAGK